MTKYLTLEQQNATYPAYCTELVVVRCSHCGWKFETKRSPDLMVKDVWMNCVVCGYRIGAWATKLAEILYE